MTTPKTVGRFAPSPTGAMHLGNARTALLAWLHSRLHGGRHLLRFEDLDSGRVRPAAYDLLRRDLEWLGLDWDAEYRQSERLDFYRQALEQLDHYPCTCTRREIWAAIQGSASAPHGEELVYPGTCRQHPAAQDRPAARRWRIPNERICFQDGLIQQPLCQDLTAAVGDFVLRRNDGVYAYHLAVVVDDALMGVTDVVRGADLWQATPRQIALQQALGYANPRHWHVPLLHDVDGQRLAKRGGAPPVMAYREAGEAPERLIAWLGRSLGWAVPSALGALELLEEARAQGLWSCLVSPLP